MMIDKDKVRAKLRNMGDEQIYGVLDRAIELLPQTKLRKLLKPYMKLEELESDADFSADLFEKVKDFQKRSLRGEYYESFMVNSKNCTEISK